MLLGPFGALFYLETLKFKDGVGLGKLYGDKEMS